MDLSNLGGLVQGGVRSAGMSAQVFLTKKDPVSWDMWELCLEHIQEAQTGPNAQSSDCRMSKCALSETVTHLVPCLPGDWVAIIIQRSVSWLLETPCFPPTLPLTI